MPIKKRLLCTFDTETTELREGLICAYPQIYDIGYAIHDKKGHIYHKRAFIIREIFMSDIMRHAFYGKKIPLYLDMLASGEREIVGFAEAIEIMTADCKQWGIDTLCAYNLSFDLRALKSTCENLNLDDAMLDGLRSYKRLCIWAAMADSVPMFTFQMWCKQNGHRTDKLNNKSSAEALGWFYGVLSGAEDHMSIEDVYLEVDLLAIAFASRKKINVGKKGNWQAFQRRRLSAWGRIQYDAQGSTL